MTAFSEFLVYLYNLRIPYPHREIFLGDDDVSSAFRQDKYHPDLVAMHCFSCQVSWQQLLALRLVTIQVRVITLYELLGYPDPAQRPNPLSLNKLESFYNHLQDVGSWSGPSCTDCLST